MSTSKTSRPASKTSRPASRTASKAPAKKAVNPVFQANLPCFKATIRGNVVADSETFTSKAGKVFETFRIAYTRFKGQGKETMFVKCLLASDDDASIRKGSYVEVTGDYQDELGEYQGNPTIYRTMFVGPDADDLKVLIDAE